MKHTKITWYIIAAIALLFTHTTTFADPTVVNNYNNTGGGGSGGSPSCTNGMSPGPEPSGPPPGTYTVKNGDGSSNTIYTTGNKQPYIVDNNCNSAPVIQPYVQPPMPGTTGTSGAAGGARR